MHFFDGIPAHGSAIALCDPILGEFSYDHLAREMRTWQSVFDKQARAQGGPLLLTVEIAARAPIIAAYLAALAGGHPVILSAPGQSAADQAVSARYRPNAVIAMNGEQCEMTPSGADRAVLHPDLRLLLSTSGTTGDPRLVRLSAAGIASNAASIAAYLGLGATDVGITALPLHYSYGMSVLHSHLAVGARLVLTEASVTDPDFSRDYRDHRVTNLPLVPHQIDLLAAMGFDFRSSGGLRFVTQAGGRLAPKKVRSMAAMAARGGWDFYVMYGQTEAGPRISYVPPADLVANADTIGRAIPGGRLWLRNAQGAEETRPGVAGELIYEGPNVMLGYADSRADLALGREIEVLCTGDIAERTAAGYFRIIGREKRFVKLYGLRISLDQIEARLAAAGLAGQAVAVGDQLVVMTLPGTDGDAVTSLLSEAFDLPRFDIATAGMPDLPTLSSGKPDLRRIGELAREALARQTRGPAPLPTGSAAHLPIAELFADATRIRIVRKEDTFQSLGGEKYATPLHESVGPVLAAGFAVPLCFMVGISVTALFTWWDRMVRGAALPLTAAASRRS